MGTINKVYDAGYDTLPKILAMSVDDFLTIDGIKDKSANKLHTNLHNAYDKASITLLLAGTNGLGEGVGMKRLEPLMEAIPKLCSKSCRLKDSTIRNKIMELEGFSGKMADKIIQNRTKCVKLLSSLPKRKPISKTKMVAAAAPPILEFSITRDVSGMSFVFTGGRMKDLEKNLVVLGAKISNTVSKKTTVLIAKDPETLSGKVKKANSLGISIMNQTEFKKWLS